MNHEPLRVILDCDTKNEVDDQFAIVHALGLPPGTLEVRGVVSVHNTLVHGPSSRDIYQEEAERVVALCGSVVPCVPGAERPMEDRYTPVRSEGLDFLVEEAARGPLTVIATGPATDVASLALTAPGVRENVRVVWLGGFGGKESYGRFKMGELNGRADIASWRALFGEPVDLLQVPGWPGPAKLLVEAMPFAAELRALGRPAADYLAEILLDWVADYEGDIDPQGQKILWDIACVSAVADPKSVTVDRLTVPTLDAAGAHDFSRRSREIDVVADLDDRRVIRGLMAALAGHSASKDS